MTTSTSFTNDLSGLGSYIFRTVPKIRYMTDALAKYVVKTGRKTKVAVCYDSKAPDNVSSNKVQVLLRLRVQIEMCGFYLRRPLR